MNTTTDEQLLAAHLQGDATAYRMLVERHYRELFRFVHRFTGSQAAAEDVVQEAFLQLHLAAASFDLNRKLKPWLFTIAANKARDYLRSRGRRREVSLNASVDGDNESGGRQFSDLMASESPVPLEELQEAEKTALVREVVDQMPPNLREVLVLAYFHHFPYKDLADILDVPLGTVKSRLHAAVATFGRLFREEQNRRGTEDV